MLTRRDLSDYRKSTGFNLGQVEKDYVQHIFLMYLYRFIDKELIFKGDTALQKTFALNRFSEDLDFTLRETLKVSEVMENTVREMEFFGLETSWSKVKDDENSVSIKIKSKGPLYSGVDRSITYVNVEMSKRGDILLPVKTEEVIPLYKDVPPYLLVVMNLSEIMAEKIRAIYTRDKARDVYDLHFMAKKGVKTSIETIDSKLSYYELEFDDKSFLEAVDRKRNIWRSELRQLITRVPHFDDVIMTVNKLDFLENQKDS